MANEKILASALGGKEHLQAWDELFEFRFATVELETLLIMMVDTVPSDALPYLADQFDLLGVNGWNACKTEQDRRNLVKRAIELKRYQGTPFAIRRALQSVGYYDAVILKNPGAFYNGKFKHDGEVTYGSGMWASIAVILDIGETKGLTEKENSEAIDLINTYKSARDKLLWIDHKCTLVDTVETNEEFTFAVNASFVEGVDPYIDDFKDYTANQATLIDTLETLDDAGINIKFVNSLGQVTAEEDF